MPIDRGAWRIELLEVRSYDSSNRGLLESSRRPGLDRVLAAIAGLDGDRRSELRIEAVDGTSLVVAGGGGRFTAAAQGGRDSSFPAASLIDRARGDAEEVVTVGGCETSLPARYILLDVEKIRRAAVRFFEGGCLDPSLEWEPL